MHEAFQFTNISNLSFLVNKNMMSNPTNNPQYSRTQTPKDQDNDDNNNNQTRKTATSTTRPQEQALKCPRCDSPNTKFCYYNNYSLSQPRHFCKTCRRYWTNGGALRNVPIGGGCRKNKKLKTTSSSRLSSDSKDSSSSDLTGFKFLHGLNPTMDFNLGGLSIPSPSIGLYNQFATFPSSVNVSNPSGIASSSGNSMLGFNNYPINGFSGAVQELGSGNSLNVNSNLASSIESLSSINQDLHWKLQQKRLGMIFGTGEVNDQKEIRSYNVSSSSSIGVVDYQSFQGVEKPQPILFQNLDVSRPELARESDTAATTTTTEWLFGHASYGLNGSDINRNGSDWNGSVSDGLHHYNALP